MHHLWSSRCFMMSMSSKLVNMFFTLFYCEEYLIFYVEYSKAFYSKDNDQIKTKETVRFMFDILDSNKFWMPISNTPTAHSFKTFDKINLQKHSESNLLKKNEKKCLVGNNGKYGSEIFFWCQILFFFRFDSSTVAINAEWLSSVSLSLPPVYH